MTTDALEQRVPRLRSLSVEAVAGVAWAALVAGGMLVGRHLYDADPLIHVGAPPLVGSYDLRVGPLALPALAVAVFGVAAGPRLARRLHFGALLAAAWVGAAAWALALAVTDGASAITRPLETRYEYLTAVPRVGENPGTFLQGFVDQLPTYATHVRGHPPGLVLVLWALDRVGLGGATVAAALVIGAGALVAPAALVALRALSGEAAARSAAPFLVLLPGAVWMATSADALFAGVLACAVAALALAAGRRDGVGRALALGAGLTFGVALAMSYGAVPFGVIPLAICLWRRDLVSLALTGLGVLLVLGALAAAGFWWWDGLQATRDLAAAGVQGRRAYLPFLLISLAAFALAVGPAAAAGLARLRTHATWVLCGGALVAVLLADLSGLSRGETERIWLPFAPWIVLAAGGLGAAGWAPRRRSASPCSSRCGRRGEAGARRRGLRAADAGAERLRLGSGGVACFGHDALTANAAADRR